MAKKKALKKNAAVDQRKLTQWAKRGKDLVNAKSGNQWEIGDWILAGEKAFGKKEAYDKAEHATGMTRATLQQFKYTAECFPISTRVENLFFGHHRLVAKKKTKSKEGMESGFTPEERQRLLRSADKRGLTVAKFDAYLKNREKNVERQERTPTNADAAARRVVELCEGLRDHLSFRALFRSDPPKDQILRGEVLAELRATAKQLNENVESLTEMWRDSDLFHYRDNEAQAAAAARAGSSR